jgi:hypothetical protein
MGKWQKNIGKTQAVIADELCQLVKKMNEMAKTATEKSI